MPQTKSLTRVVIDTNLIIAGRYKPGSASNRIIDMCIDRKLIAVYSGKTKDENLFILQKVSPPKDYIDKILRFYSRSIYIPNPDIRISICSDYSDNRYFEAAIAGQAQYIISNDRHLLDHDGYHSIRVMRPSAFLKHLNEKKEDPPSYSDGWIVD
ncbi:MAG: putative toxin-antitoxin system toxin component, PIN family [Candidatus Aenigmatarchaeota archaeon]|nr:MAG: putative toxin-antitoxin system toxin component, PIN family [Candidatus Aenigmarchaeota archaeon]